MKRCGAKKRGIYISARRKPLVRGLPSFPALQQPCSQHSPYSSSRVRVKHGVTVSRQTTSKFDINRQKRLFLPPIIEKAIKVEALFATTLVSDQL